MSRSIRPVVRTTVLAVGSPLLFFLAACTGGTPSEVVVTVTETNPSAATSQANNSPQTTTAGGNQPSTPAATSPAAHTVEQDTPKATPGAVTDPPSTQDTLVMTLDGIDPVALGMTENELRKRGAFLKRESPSFRDACTYYTIPATARGHILNVTVRFGRVIAIDPHVPDGVTDPAQVITYNGAAVGKRAGLLLSDLPEGIDVIGAAAGNAVGKALIDDRQHTLNFYYGTTDANPGPDSELITITSPRIGEQVPGFFDDPQCAVFGIPPQMEGGPDPQAWWDELRAKSSDFQ